MPDWYSADGGPAQERLMAAWAGAPVDNEELCGFILDTARTQVLAYAPETPTYAEADEVPANLVLAQLRQAENLWAAGRADENGEIGPEGFSYTPRPLDKTIRNMIRPTRGLIHAL